MRSDSALTEDVVHAYCKQHLTNYKRPSPIEFRDDPPKTHVEKKFSDEHRVRRFDAFHARAS